MGWLEHVTGRIVALAHGPLRQFAKKKAKSLLEKVSGAVLKRVPIQHLPPDQLAALRTTLQIDLPEWGENAAGEAVDALADSVNAQVQRALA